MGSGHELNLRLTGSGTTGSGIRKTAARTGVHKGTFGSYTAKSNAINGRMQHIQVGHGGHSQKSSGPELSGYEKFVQTMMGINMSMQMVGQTAQMVKQFGTLTVGHKLTSGDYQNALKHIQSQQQNAPAQTGVDNVLATTLSNLGSKMDKAEYSSDLKVAINEAKTYLNGELQTQIQTAKTNAEVAEEQLKTLDGEGEGSVKAAEKGVKEAASNTTIAKQSVEALKLEVGKYESNRNEANNILTQANAEYKTAVGNTNTTKGAITAKETDITSKEASVAELTATLNSVPDLEKPAIQTQLNVAKGELEKAKGELEKLNKQLIDNEKAEANALNKVDTSKQELADAKEKVQTANKKLKESEKNLKEKEQLYEQNKVEEEKARANLTELQNKQKDANGSVQKYKSLQKQETSLKQDIAKYEAELTKKIKSESDKIAKLQAEIKKYEAESDKQESKMNISNLTSENPIAPTKAELKAGKRMQVAETKEAELRRQLEELQSHHSSA